RRAGPAGGAPGERALRRRPPRAHARSRRGGTPGRGLRRLHHGGRRRRCPRRRRAPDHDDPLTMTNRTLRRTLRGTALTLALAAGVGAAPSAAQVELPRDPAPQAGLSARGGLPEPGDGFDWERAGDRPIAIFAIAFGPDGPPSATGSGGPPRLPLARQ